MSTLPDYLYVDPLTNECSEEIREGWDRVWSGQVVPPREEVGQPDSEWLGNYVTRRLVEIDAAEAAAKETHRQVMRGLHAERRALDYMYFKRLEAVVQDDLSLQKGKPKKSVQYAYGKAGFEKPRGQGEIFDAGTMVQWAMEHHPEAIEYPEPRVLVSKLPKEGEIPGLRRPGPDRFFVRPTKAKTQEGGA